MKLLITGRSYIADLITMSGMLNCEISFLIEALKETNVAYRVMEIMELQADTMADLDEVEWLIGDLIMAAPTKNLKHYKAYETTEAVLRHEPYRLVLNMRKL